MFGPRFSCWWSTDRMISSTCSWRQYRFSFRSYHFFFTSKFSLTNRFFSRRQTLREIFSQLTTSPERWAAFQQHTESVIQSVTSTNKVKDYFFLGKEKREFSFWLFEKYRKAAYTTLVNEIMFEYCYPRPDANVTKGMNHLLKSPFSVHRKTSRISIPIYPNSLAHFDPCKDDAVRRLDQLCQQVEHSLTFLVL